MKYIIYIIVLVLNLLVALCLLLADIGVLISPTVFPIPSIIGIGFEWLILLQVPFTIFWLFTQRKSWCLISIVTLLCSIGGIHNTIRFTNTEQTVKTTQSLKIISYNTMGLGGQVRGDISKNKVLNYIRMQHADIVCLQEMVSRKGSYSLQEIKDYLGYPYSYYDFKLYKGKRNLGLAIFSKYPIINKQCIQYYSNTNLSNQCDIIVNSDTLRLITNHLQSNKLTQDDLSLPTEKGQELSNEVKAKAETIGRKLYKNTRIRAQQAQSIQTAIKASPYPVIVCGDFNDVPVSYTYHTISSGLQDAFLQSNQWSLGHTFYKHNIGIRIDYILHDKRLQASNFKIDNVSYSDHLPISCTLSW